MSSQLFKMGIIALLSAILITSLTYFISRPGQSLYCTPINPITLAQGPAGNQVEHGFPLTYYKEAIPSDCTIPDTGDAPINKEFSLGNFVLDTIFAGLFFLVVISIAGKLWRKNG